MRFAALVSASILGLTILAAATAQTPSRTSLSGKITVLKPTTITVHGGRNLTCRITKATPRVFSRGFKVGSTVKITCRKGVLAAINLVPRVVPGTVTTTGTTTTTDDGLPTDPIPGTGGVKVAPTVNGAGTITALGSGQIEFGNAITCQLGSNSPSTGSYRVGSRVAYTCVGGTLIKIGASEGT